MIFVDPQIMPNPTRDQFVLLKGFDFYGHLIPQGFQFDGASVPRFFWRIVPPARPWVLRAACGHDWLYASGNASKEEADRLFLRALEEDGAGKFISQAMYASVKTFGNAAYKRYRELDGGV